MLAMQDSFVTVQAAGDIVLGGIFEPTRIPTNFGSRSSGYQVLLAAQVPLSAGASFDSYGANSGVALASTAGDVTVNTLVKPDYIRTLFAPPATSVDTGLTGGYPAFIPPTLEVAAANGDILLLSSFASPDINLFPSATGTLSLAAGGSIIGRVSGNNNYAPTVKVAMYEFGISDPTGNLATVLPLLGSPAPAPTVALHAGDDRPVIVYAGEDIFGGAYTLLKPARLWAGRDLIDVTFTGQNNAAAEVTTIVAGRDIAAAQTPTFTGTLAPGMSSFTLYGPGDLLIEAGRDLGPFNTDNGTGGGVFTVGDGANSSLPVKAYLPLEGADITLRYGVAPGIDYAAAIARYVDPSDAGEGGISLLAPIATALGKGQEEAWVAFQALSPERQKLLIDRAFLDFLAEVGLDHSNAGSPYQGQYRRAYEAIATLFPAVLGYTDNNSGESNGASVTVHTGDLRMPRSLVETQTGGDINILGPGGNAFVGSNAADRLTPAQQGVLTLQGGSIRSYTDGSVLIFQSRVFTEQGGDVKMFSANGDLNAGKGPKSSAAYPPLRLICDTGGYCRVNPAGLVTGAGIGALLSVVGQDPALSNVVLTAPHGTVDAGAAGIRVAGNLTIVALHVANAFNIDVGGIASGIPTAAAPNVGALTAASNSAGAAATAADDAARRSRQTDGNRDLPSIITVEVIGYGGGDGRPREDDGEERRRRRSDRRDQDPASRYQVLAAGPVSDEEGQRLAEERRRQVGR
jgi:hypothetical protein